MVSLANLPPGTEGSDLMPLMQQAGECVWVQVDGGSGFAHFAHPGEARKAIATLNGAEIHGQRIAVDAHFTKKKSRPCPYGFGAGQGGGDAQDDLALGEEHGGGHGGGGGHGQVHGGGHGEADQSWGQGPGYGDHGCDCGIVHGDGHGDAGGHGPVHGGGHGATADQSLGRDHGDDVCECGMAHGDGHAYGGHGW